MKRGAFEKKYRYLAYSKLWHDHCCQNLTRPGNSNIEYFFWYVNKDKTIFVDH